MKPFFDTNILVYAMSQDPRSSRAQALLASGGVASVQVMNEFVNVSQRKMRKDWPAIERALEDFQKLLGPIYPIDIETNRAAVILSRDHGFQFYDSLIIASALVARCQILLTEEMQHGRIINGLSIRNPFV